MKSDQPRKLAGLEHLPPVSIAESLTVRESLVDLWCLFYDGIDDPELLAPFDALMTPAERDQQQRFRFERDRNRFLATRGLVRTVLSSYAPVSPADWRFAVGEHGKPRIAHPMGGRPIHFNLSNTDGLVVCAVSLAHEQLGVDVETTDRAGAAASIADSYFAPYEARALRALPPAEQGGRFLAYWTLKESYVKARGLGLALPLDWFWFSLDDGPQIRITFDERLADRPASWRFALLRASARHLLAVGVDTGGAPLSLRATRVVPVRGGLRLS